MGEPGPKGEMVSGHTSSSHINTNVRGVRQQALMHFVCLSGGSRVKRDHGASRS